MQTKNNRPLSPHLTIYRPQITSVLSISHRISGVLLALAAVLLVWWLSALAVGPDYFATVQVALGSGLGRIVLFFMTLAVFYHLCNGIRHLVWDTVHGFELEAIRRGGQIVVAAAVALTVVVWLIAYLGRG